MKRKLFVALLMVCFIREMLVRERVIREVPAGTTEQAMLAGIFAPAAPTTYSQKPITGPVREIKVYKLFRGYNSNDDFGASGIFALDNYFYVVFDNRFEIGKILNTLPLNSASNTLTGSGSGSSNFEAITYDNYQTPHWYVCIESEQNGSNWYPRIREYDVNLNYQSSAWTDVPFTASNNNKAFEGIAYVRRNNEDYLLCVVEGTGKICVMQQTGNTWTKVDEFFLPVTFSDYSDIALYGNKMAVLSQADALLWVGQLSSSSWSTTGSYSVYNFPTGHFLSTFPALNIQIDHHRKRINFL